MRNTKKVATEPEILYYDHKAYLIDANFGRIAGGSVALQIAKSTGKTIEEIYAHVIETTFFPDSPNHKNFYPENKIKTLSIFYSVDQSSTFIELYLPGTIRSKHIQLVDKGKKLKPIGSDNRSWIGFLIGFPDEVLQEIQLISVLTDKGILKPVF